MRPLEDGDIVKVDVTVFLDGFHGDSCRTLCVGSGVDAEGLALVAAARECLLAGIAACGPGVPFAEIGAAVEARAEALGVTNNRAFCGHGIGRFFHGPPDIFHFAGSPSSGRMGPGMCFTVEPCILQGRDGVDVWARDGWTAATVDQARAAQWEHTLLVTDDGARVLTRGADESLPMELI
jgi:methionyl aminopeptidase